MWQLHWQRVNTCRTMNVCGALSEHSLGRVIFQVRSCRSGNLIVKNAIYNIRGKRWKSN